MKSKFPFPEVNNRLRLERLLRRWAQVDLAERAKVGQPRISAIENCRSKPSEKEREKLSAALGLAVDVVFPVDREIR